MNVVKRFRLILAGYILFSCQTLWSAQSCKDLFLPFKQIQLAKYRAVQQCRGTCYFEATLAQVENTLSLKYGQDVAISRVHLFAELIKERMASKKFLEWENQVIRSKKSKVSIKLLDLVSSGTQEQMISLIEKRGLVIFDRVSRDLSQVALENKMLERIDEGVSMHLHSFMQGHLSKRELHRRIMEDLNTIKEIEMLRLKKKTSVREIKDQVFHTRYETEISSDIDFRSLQKRIIELIGKNKGIFLAYKVHENDSVSDARLVSWKKNMVDKNTEGHGVLVVGYKLNSNGGIESLKIRDSQGESHGHRGYFQMPMAYLKERLMFMSSIRVGAF